MPTHTRRGRAAELFAVGLRPAQVARRSGIGGAATFASNRLGGCEVERIVVSFDIEAALYDTNR
jgi:hypothetical protein